MDRAFTVPLLKPHEQVGRLVIVSCIGPIRVALGTVIAVGVLAPSVFIGALRQNSYCHAVIVYLGISLPVIRCVGVRTTVLLQWHYSILVLVANLHV